MKHEFKIGDRARLIRNDVPFNAGEIVEVVGFSPDGEPTVRIGERAHWVFSYSLEPIESAPSCTPSSTPGIKAGDKVRVVRRGKPDDVPSWNPSMDSTIGEVGTVTEVCSSGYLRVKFDNGQKWYYKPEWLEPVPPTCADGSPAISSAIQAVRGMFGFVDKQPVPDVPLLESTRLLTTIKLD